MADPAETIVREYLERMAQIRSTGGATGETSYYSTLETLLNEVGRGLKPAVVCSGQLRDQGERRWSILKQAQLTKERR